MREDIRELYEPTCKSVSIHSPLYEGGRLLRSGTLSAQRDFYTLPSYEGRHPDVPEVRWVFYFYTLPSYEGRQSIGHAMPCNFVSILPSYEGDDEMEFEIGQIKYFYTLPLVWGETTRHEIISGLLQYFYTLPSYEGGDHDPEPDEMGDEFLYTPLVWGETHHSVCADGNSISIHSPRMRGDAICDCNAIKQVISIHSPCMRGDSTVTVNKSNHRNVSIHFPLRMRGETVIWKFHICYRNFYTLPSYEGRPKGRLQVLFILKFLYTLLVWGGDKRTETHGNAWRVFRISIHSPSYEGRPK